MKPRNYKESLEQQQATCNEVLAFLLRALNHHIFSKIRSRNGPVRESALEDASHGRSQFLKFSILCWVNEMHNLSVKRFVLKKCCKVSSLYCLKQFFVLLYKRNKIFLNIIFIRLWTHDEDVSSQENHRTSFDDL